MIDLDVKWMFMYINYLYSDVFIKKKSKFFYLFKWVYKMIIFFDKFGVFLIYIWIEFLGILLVLLVFILCLVIDYFFLLKIYLL